jgi:CHAT domain-containing protein/tetratricopeptide (TPR) repeat protein
MGHAAEAIDPFLSALPQLQGHPVETVAVLNRLGVAYQERGQTGDAFGIYQKALAISQKEGDPSGQAGALNGLGQIYANWGEFESARRDYERSLELWRQLGYAAYEADLLGNLAELDLVVGRLEDARDASSKALAIHQERRDQGGEINSLRKLGEVLTQLDKPKPALQVLERSVDLARKIGNKRYWLWSLEALGVALLREKSLDRASTVYDQARDLSLELQSPHDTAEVVSDLAEIAELRGDRPAALAGFEQARAMYERLGEPAAVAWTLASRASAYQAADSLPEARADLEAALAIVENLRVKPRASASRASFLASRHGYYETYIDVLMRLGRRRSDKAYEQLAFEASERARARALLDDLGRSGTLLLSGVDGKLQEQAVGLEHRLRDLEGQLQGISSDGREADASRSAVKAEIEATVEKQDALRKQIQQNHPHYAALTQPHPLSLQEIQEQVLEDGTVLLAYSLGEDRSYLWLIRRSSWTSRELPGRRVIEAAAIDLYNALSRQNPKANAEAVRATAAKLSQLVIQPIASELGQDRLVVVADGALQYIPFATLPASPALPGRLLIREHEIVSLPSASIPAVLRQEIAGRPSPPKLLAALADPVFQASDERVPEAFRKISSYSSSTGLADVLRSARDLGISGFGRLRYSQIEAKAIVSLAPPGMSFLALGFDATRDLALQSILRQYRILHFATHSLLDSRHPDLSGIVLSLVDAHGRPLDGFLRAYDIYNLSLPVDLVVLSACQTALGKDVKGEGLISLTRGFMYAGAPRVVVSLWNVSDRGTAEFMTRFYRSMLVGGLKPAAALRAAQISMSEDPQWSPNSWAGFVLQGEWR